MAHKTDIPLFGVFCCNIDKMNKKTILEIYLILVSSLIIIFSKLDGIYYDPAINSSEWCTNQPCFEFSGLTLVQPSSSFFVYLLGLITIIFGIDLVKKSNVNKDNSKLWWGYALLLWGFGAIFAGTSYQLFSYELKCIGNENCLWTSWWEVVYLLFSIASVDAMMVAQSYRLRETNALKICKFAVIHFVIYSVTLVIGSMIPIKFLISFELMIGFFAPLVLFFLFLNMKQYKIGKKLIDKHLIYIWLLLGIIMILYYTYLLLGLSEMFWENGVWISENDILHIGLIGWMTYIWRIVK